MIEKAKLFDKRVVDRNIDKGIITQDDVSEYLSSLPDMENESELLELDSEEAEEEELQEEEKTEDQGFNFESVNQGPKNVYDF